VDTPFNRLTLTEGLVLAPQSLCIFPSNLRQAILHGEREMMDTGIPPSAQSEGLARRPCSHTESRGQAHK